ncbi:MAG: hypothetical protein WCI64_10265 [Chlorobium sp.]
MKIVMVIGARPQFVKAYAVSGAITLLSLLSRPESAGVILAVAHDEFKSLDIKISLPLVSIAVYDVKGVLLPDVVGGRL